MCFLFGLLFLLRKQVNLSSASAVPFGFSAGSVLFYLFGLKAKQESLKKRLYNQLLFCLIFSLGSFYISILFIDTANASYKFILSRILFAVYLVLVIISLGVEANKIPHGKYVDRQSKVVMTSPYIYVGAALFGVFLSKVIQNASQNAKNINNIIPYILAFVFFIISIFLVPFFANTIRIHLLKIFLTLIPHSVFLRYAGRRNRGRITFIR